MSNRHRTIPLIPIAASGVAPLERIHPRSVRGRFSQARLACVLLTQGLFYGLPWLNWQGRQAVLFDLEGRRFHFFGAVLFPQDLILLTGVLVFSALLLFAATALVGRVWCGFACPQTVYTGMFMWLERRLEGDRLARLRLDDAPWGGEKLLRRGGKHLAWAALALLTGFSLVSWFTPARSLAAALPTLAFGPWEAFWILFYAAATYVHAGLLREKVCQHACPYGRFQGSMLDAGTRVIAYDSARGEPRGARARGEDARARGQGDCVDCTLCVQVCPVGIDIRQGLQADCISCGLCIDACDNVMDKLQAPRGLIRFQALAPTPTQGRWWARPRVLVYASALLLVGGAVVWGWVTRPELRLNVLRDRSVLSRQVEDGAVENVYRLQLMNASLQPRRLALSAAIDGERPLNMQVHLTHALTVEPAGTAQAVLTLRLDAASAQRLAPAQTVPIRIELRDAQEEGAGRVAEAAAASTFVLR